MADKKILFVDACPRKRSRTRILAEALLDRLDGDICRLWLPGENIPELDEDAVNKRSNDGDKDDFSSPVYRYSRQFAEADIIVIAAPFWDLSFPAILKKYIESVSVSGITFRYNEQGIPEGLCNADKLFYVTTAGGPIYNPEFGFGYIETLSKMMFGIKDVRLFKAEFLDIWGNDPEQIILDSIKDIQSADLS